MLLGKGHRFCIYCASFDSGWRISSGHGLQTGLLEMILALYVDAIVTFIYVLIRIHRAP